MLEQSPTVEIQHTAMPDGRTLTTEWRADGTSVIHLDPDWSAVEGLLQRELYFCQTEGCQELATRELEAEGAAVLHLCAAHAQIVLHHVGGLSEEEV